MNQQNRPKDQNELIQINNIKKNTMNQRTNNHTKSNIPSQTKLQYLAKVITNQLNEKFTMSENSGWCVPTMLYFIVFIVSFGYTFYKAPKNIPKKEQPKQLNLLSQYIIYGLLFFIILYLLCMNQYKVMSMVLMVIPFIIFSVIYLTVVEKYDFCNLYKKYF
jgi:hypothetical protein